MKVEWKDNVEGLLGLSFQASAPISILHRPGFNNKLPMWMDFKKIFRFSPTKKKHLTSYLWQVYDIFQHNCLKEVTIPLSLG